LNYSIFAISFSNNYSSNLLQIFLIIADNFVCQKCFESISSCDLPEMTAAAALVAAGVFVASRLLQVAGRSGNCCSCDLWPVAPRIKSS